MHRGVSEEHGGSTVEN